MGELDALEAELCRVLPFRLDKESNLYFRLNLPAVCEAVTQ